MLIGLIGKTNAGKSTFFKAATLAEIAIASHPFTTIKPNHGIGYVKIKCVDSEFNIKCQPKHGFCLENYRFVPFELLDVAGLVPGASEGKGLGNQFLDDLRQADVFIHIVDASGTTNEEGKTVPEGDYDPCNDVEFLEYELNKWYCNILKKVWKTFARKSEIEDTELHEAVAKQFSGLKVDDYQVKQVLSKLKFKEKPSQWNDEQIMQFAESLRKISKPMIIAANKCDLPNSRENIEKMEKEFPDYIIIPCSADSELALREAAKHKLINYISGEKKFDIIGEITDKQKQALEQIKKNVLDVYEKGTGVQEVLNSAVFDLLKYIPVFPVENVNKLTDSKGKVLPDCFLLPQGSTALDFAYALHTDFGEKFIRAIDAKSKRVLGKDYVLKNRDVLEIITK